MLYRTLFPNPYPNVRFISFHSDSNPLTTYTFSDVKAITLGGTGSTAFDTYTSHAHVRVSSKSAVGVFVHAIDDLATFSITSVTLGGVAGTERADRGGGTTALNSGFYTWNTDSIGNITNQTIVVTMSEAVSCCGVGVVIIENIGVLTSLGGGGAAGTGALSTSPASSVTAFDRHPTYLCASTLAATNENAQWSITGTSPMTHPVLLYEETFGTGRASAAWCYAPCYCGPLTYQMEVSWSGGAQGDLQTVFLM